MGVIHTVPNGEDFIDPVLRCDSCNKLVRRVTLHKLGCCNLCGNKRIRALDVFNADEKAQMIEWGFQDFVNEYEAVDDE